MQVETAAHSSGRFSCYRDKRTEQFEAGDFVKAFQSFDRQARLTQIVAGKRSITGDTALRLGRWFKNSPEFWLDLQTQYDLRLAELEAGKEIDALPVRPTTKKQQPSLI